ncbi:MAG: hypothetical protein JXR96_02485 [Deltaproteobacteria bacterium]|nr:hypothetical protein [Deltaproteobacteria bacterium]
MEDYDAQRIAWLEGQGFQSPALLEPRGARRARCHAPGHRGCPGPPPAPPAAGRPPPQGGR